MCDGNAAHLPMLTDLMLLIPSKAQGKLQALKPINLLELTIPRSGNFNCKGIFAHH